MAFWKINRTYRNLQRMQTILNVLLKHGFGQLIRQLGLHRLLPLGKRASALSQDDSVSPLDPLTMPERLRFALEELGPTFIKFGQVLSTRPDILPDNFIVELKKLREDIRPMPFPAIRKTIEDFLGDTLENAFEEFSELPLATASIGQVHTGKLKTGEAVVVKIRRPGIETIVKNDLDILHALAGILAGRIEEMARFDPKGLVREFEKTILQEMDFNVEALNMERFRENFRSEERVVIPEVYWAFSGKTVITMQRLTGLRLEDPQILQNAGHDPRELAREGIRIFLRQVLEFGFFHADPHPGNVLALPDSRIGMIDFGMVGRLDAQTSEHLGSLILNVVHKNYDRLLVSMRKLGFEFDELSSADLRREIMEIIELHYGLPLQKIGIGELLSKLIETVLRFGVELPGGFLTLTRALVVSEGVGRQLDPDIDVIAISKPMLQNILKRRRDPYKLINEAMSALQDLRHVATVFPRYVEILLLRLLRGKLRIEFSHANLENFYRVIERTGNRLSFSIVVASLILGSSIIMYSRLGPFVFGYPAIGVIGYTLAALLGIWLLINIIRSGRI
jgi:ubiquinone biosynthesis protein